MTDMDEVLLYRGSDGASRTIEVSQEELNDDERFDAILRPHLDQGFTWVPDMTDPEPEALPIRLMRALKHIETKGFGDDTDSDAIIEGAARAYLALSEKPISEGKS